MIIRTSRLVGYVIVPWKVAHVLQSLYMELLVAFGRSWDPSQATKFDPASVRESPLRSGTKTSGLLGFLTKYLVFHLWRDPWTYVAPKWVEVMESLHIFILSHLSPWNLWIVQVRICQICLKKSHRSCVKRIMRCHCSGQSAWNLRRWRFLFHKVSQQKPNIEIWASQAFFWGRGVGVDTKNLPNQDVDTWD